MNRAHRPRSLSEATALLAREPDLRPVAGCTDLMVTEPARREEMTAVLDLLAIAEIHGVSRRAGFWEIGATTTFTEIARHAELAAALPALAAAAREVGGWQIQNRATVGGNVVNASPAGDSLPVLLALDAVAVAVGAGGAREIPYGTFYAGYRKTVLRPGEILGWMRVPDPAPAVQVFRKVGTRRAQAISKVVAALTAERDGARLVSVRLAAGSVAATPVRLCAAEAVLEGAVPDAALADRAGAAAAGEVTPIDDVRSTAEYRRFALARVVRRMVLEVGSA